MTGRFHNVISLLNSSGQIPLMAIQIKGVKINGAFTLIATRVVDPVRLGTEEEDVNETIDRPYWESRSSAASLKVMDQVLDLIREISPKVEPKFNKNNIGLTIDGRVRNFALLRPRKDHVLTEFRIPENKETTTRLDKSGLAVEPYSRFGYYRARVWQNDLDERHNIILDFIREAHDSSGMK